MIVPVVFEGREGLGTIVMAAAEGRKLRLLFTLKIRFSSLFDDYIAMRNELLLLKVIIAFQADTCLGRCLMNPVISTGFHHFSHQF